MKSLMKILRYGYFGEVLKVRIFDEDFCSIRRTYQKEEFFFFGKKIGVRNLPSSFTQSSILNSVMSRRNDEILKKIHSKGSQIIKRDDVDRESPVGCSTGKNKIILLMTDHLFIVGGAETRIVRTAELLEDLKFIPVILSQHNNHPPSQKFFNLTLDYRDPNLSSIISSWIERGLIHGIEFHIKNPRVLYDLPLFDWKNKIVLGVQIHNVFSLTDRLQQQLDHCRYIVSSQSDFVPKSSIVRNWIEYLPPPIEPLWQFKQQKQALFISRLSKDKATHFLNFVSFCRKQGLDFHIASDWPERSWQHHFIESLALESHQFIGPISTAHHLRRFMHKYLFIAGVGQIPLEAASLGFPAAVVSSKRSSDFAEPLIFLDLSNVEFLHQWNFVINQCPIENLTPNGQKFIDDFRNGKVSAEFGVSQKIQKLRTPEKLVKIYQTFF